MTEAKQTILFENRDTRAIDGVRVCIGGVCGDRQAIECEGLATCSLEYDLPVGCYSMTVRAMLGELESVDSNAKINPMFDPVICHDSNGDSVVNTTDFGSFLSTFNLF